MEIYRIAFIGHREIYESYLITDALEKIAVEKICEKEYVEFYVGRHGDFDILAASAVKMAQRKIGHHNSSLILLQPYKMKDDSYYEVFYDEVQYPVTAHPKAAIGLCNRWMIDRADLIIAFVEDERRGGAYTAIKYAEKVGVLSQKPNRI